MSMKMVCNRCNKVKEDREHFNSIRYIRSDSHYEDSEYDLCPECSKLFSIFIDGGTVEEDRYKDSKPSAVVIHKLADGHYGIENVPKGEEAPKHSCVDCAYSYRYRGMLCCGSDCGGDFISGDMICSSWESKEDDQEEPMNKEESDLCVKAHKVTCPTTGVTVTVPDSEPWVCAGTGRIHHKKRKDCSNCRYSAGSDESGLNYGPCIGDKIFHTAHNCDLWERRSIADDEKEETGEQA